MELFTRIPNLVLTQKWLSAPTLSYLLTVPVLMKMLLRYFYLLQYFYYDFLPQTRSKSKTGFGKATQMLSSMPMGDKFKPKKVSFETNLAIVVAWCLNEGLLTIYRQTPTNCLQWTTRFENCSKRGSIAFLCAKETIEITEELSFFCHARVLLFFPQNFYFIPQNMTCGTLNTCGTFIYFQDCALRYS